MPSEPKDLLEYKTDHDLLIELRTEMRNLSKAIDRLNDGVSSRLKDLEDDVASLKTTRAIAYAYAGLITLILIPIAAAYIQVGKL